MSTITTPELCEGEIYAGILLNENGTPSHHLILLPGDTKSNWETAKQTAEAAGGELPTQREQSLLFANCKQHFKGDWYWSGETHGDSSSWAWYQNFDYGTQDYGHKLTALRARAVRRLVIE